MNITALISHYKTGKMTAYAVHQLLINKGKHDLQILICDNSNGEGLEYLKPFGDDVKIITYPTDKLQSHGVGYDYLMPYVETDHFITMESDSFPTRDTYLDYYEYVINEGYDMMGSMLQLSGGLFVHVAGACYSKKLYDAAKEFVKTFDYTYYPNLAMKEEFPCHLMVHNDILPAFIEDPSKFIEVSKSYLKGDKSLMRAIGEEYERYRPIAEGVFHNGMGYNQESYYTYGQRNPETGLDDMTRPQPIEPFVYRLGQEPGSWLFNFAISHHYKVGSITTKTQWMPNRENQQQEYTLMDSSIKHLWGISAYDKCESADVQDIVKFKTAQVEFLYNSMEAKYKI